MSHCLGQSGGFKLPTDKAEAGPGLACITMNTPGEVRQEENTLSIESFLFCFLPFVVVFPRKCHLW